MRLGLLLCDHVRPELQPAFGDYPDFFARLLPTADIRVFDLTAADFPDLESCDAWISSGSRHSVYDDLDWILRLKALLHQIDQERRKYVGICFGAQMIAEALGGKVTRAREGWQVGIKQAHWVGGGSFRILHSNADQIAELSPEMRVVATTATNPIEVVEVGDHFLGFQGHPEFTTEYVAALIEARRGTSIPAAVADAGLASLGQSPDTAKLREVILRWLDGAPPEGGIPIDHAGVEF
jgi:GMP synthase-like glutamine amidotransferase